MQIEEWKKTPGGTILVGVFGRGALDPGAYGARELTQTTIRRFLKSNTARVTLPTPKNRPRMINEAPFFSLVSCITEDQAEYLADQAIISTRDITLICVHHDVDPPTLLTIYRDIHAFGVDTDETLAEEQLTEIFANAFLELAEAIFQLIEADIANEGRWKGYTAEQAFWIVIGSVRVTLGKKKLRGDETDPIALVYCEPPTADAGGWYAFRSLVESYPFGSTYTGHPYPSSERMWCGMCHTIDHTTKDCYLPTVPHWHGPNLDKLKAAVAEKRNEARRDRGPKRDQREGEAPRGRTY